MCSKTQIGKTTGKAESVINYMIMKPTTLIALASLGLFAPSLTHADVFRASDIDKQAHMAASYAGTLTLGALYRKVGVEPRLLAPLSASISMFFVGLTKEALDRRYSTADIKANAIGCLAGGVFTWTF